MSSQIRHTPISYLFLLRGCGQGGGETFDVVSKRQLISFFFWAVVVVRFVVRDGPDGVLMGKNVVVLPPYGDHAMPKCVIPSTHNTLHSKSSVEREKKGVGGDDSLGLEVLPDFREGCVSSSATSVEIFSLVEKSFFATSLYVRGDFTEMGVRIDLSSEKFIFRKRK